MQSDLERIVLGGGCFWCTEAAIAMLDGITSVVPGYSGGTTENPTYQEVCGGRTGHAEVVSVEFDPSEVPLEDILEIFFASHDPTTPDRQGADVGTQYRSIILYDSEEQRERIEGFIEGIREGYQKPIVTEVQPLTVFYPAEEYHHSYYEKNPGQPYCMMVISPKIAKLKSLMSQGS